MSVSRDYNITIPLFVSESHIIDTPNSNTLKIENITQIKHNSAMTLVNSVEENSSFLSKLTYQGLKMEMTNNSETPQHPKQNNRNHTQSWAEPHQDQGVPWHPPHILMMVNYTTVVGLNGYNCIIWPPFYIIICHVIITNLIFWTI